MSKRVAVKFKRSHPPYNVGELAGFSPDKAAYLVKAGVARYADKAIARRERLRAAWRWLRSPRKAFRGWYMAQAYVSPPGDPELELMIQRSALAVRVEHVARWLRKHWPTFARDVLVIIAAAMILALLGLS